MITTWNNKLLYAVEERHIEMLANAMRHVSFGDIENAFNTMRTICTEGEYPFQCVRYSLQMMIFAQPDGLSVAFSYEDWKLLSDALLGCKTFHDIADTLLIWAVEANDRLGGF